MAQQTAIEYLFHKLWDTPKDKLNWYAILREAKQMEKEQIIKAYTNGSPEFFDMAEQYYNETYESNT